MSTLTDIVSRVIDACQTADGSIITADAITMGIPLVKSDPEAVDLCIAEALQQRVKKAATRAAKVAIEAPDGQPSLFHDLHPRYAVDAEGRRLKNTRSLSRLEFEYIRKIRREQIVHDQAHLAVLDKVAAALSPIWDECPDLSFGDAERRYLEIQAAA